MNRARALAVGGVAGPVVFVSSWVVLGAATPDYAPVDDAISRLAASGAPYRGWMTAGMLAFGVGVGVHAVGLRGRLPGRSWVFLASGALATLAVAGLPLGISSTVDRIHGLAAAASYVSLSASALVAGRAWLPEQRRRGGVSLAAGGMAAALLAASAAGPMTGLFQRAGLTVVDTWIMATALAVITERGVGSPDRMNTR